jgi:CheY-like chemotaxis protein
MKHILVVDDDGLMREIISRALPEFHVTVVPDGPSALAIAKGGGAIHLLITDYLMPSMMGDELIGRMRELRPGLKVLILTGHAETLAREFPAWWASESHLSKPFRVDALRQAVASLIGLPEKT